MKGGAGCGRGGAKVEPPEPLEFGRGEKEGLFVKSHTPKKVRGKERNGGHRFPGPNGQGGKQRERKKVRPPFRKKFQSQKTGKAPDATTDLFKGNEGLVKAGVRLKGSHPKKKKDKNSFKLPIRNRQRGEPWQLSEADGSGRPP